MLDRYDEVILLLRVSGIESPEDCCEYGDGSEENYGVGEWYLWSNGRPTQDCSPEQNALLNEWKKLV